MRLFARRGLSGLAGIFETEVVFETWSSTISPAAPSARSTRPSGWFDLCVSEPVLSVLRPVLGRVHVAAGDLSLLIRCKYCSRIAGSDFGGVTRYWTYCSSESSTISDVKGVTRPNSWPRAMMPLLFFSTSRISSASCFCAQRRRSKEPSTASAAETLNDSSTALRSGTP